MCSLFASSVRADDRPVDSLASPEQIRDLLTQWQERITVLRIVWEVTYHDLDGQLKQGRATMNRWTTDWVWCKDGRGRSRHVSYLNDQFRENELQADDGELAYDATYTTADAPQNMPATLVLEGSRSFRSSYAVTPLEGIYFSPQPHWLAPRLETDSVEAWGYESVGNRVLPFVKFEDRGLHILVLDPEAGYLPRIVRSGGSDALTEVFRVDRFEEIEPGFWFPMSGTLQQRSQEFPEMNGIKRWTVKEVKINPTVDQPDFQIRPTKGTRVTDRFMAHTYTFGPGMPPETMANGLNRKLMDWLASPGSPNPFKTPTVAEPADSRRAVVLLVLLLLCFGAFIGSLYWRHFAAER